MRVAVLLVMGLMAQNVVAAPVLGPEFSLRPTDAGVTSPFAYDPRVASAGGQFLTVWRADTAGVLAGVRLAVRTSADGTMLDAAPQELATNVSYESLSGGTSSYLFVWRAGPLVRGRTIGLDGVAGTPFTVATAAADGLLSGWVAGAWTVVWRDESTSNIMVTRVHDSGAVDPPVVVASLALQGWPLYWAMSCSNTQCLLTFFQPDLQPDWVLRNIRISPQLGLVEGGSIDMLPSPGHGDWPRSASNGTDFLVMWVAVGSPTHNALVASRVTASGVVADLSPFLVSDEPAFARKYSVASNGVDYVVAWSAADILRGLRLGSDGVLLDSEPVQLISGAADAPALAANADEYFLAFRTFRDTATASVFGARFGFELSPLDLHGFSLSTNGDRQVSPSVAVRVEGYVAAWAERGANGHFGIVGTSLSASGVPLNGGAFTVARDGGTRVGPRVACEGKRCLLVWQESTTGDSDVYGAILDGAGLVDERGFPIATGPGAAVRPAVSWDGEAFLVVWEDTSADEADIHAARVSTSGTILTRVAPLMGGPGRQASPATDWRGDSSLVAWHSTFDAGVYATRFDAGMPGGSIHPFLLARGPRKFEPGVTRSADGFFVSWVEFESSGDRLIVKGVNAGAASLSGEVLLGGGASWNTTWDERDVVFASSTYPHLGAPVVGALIDVADSGSSNAPFELSAAAGGLRNPVVACASKRRCLALWESPSTATHLREIHARTLLNDERPTADPFMVTLDEDVAMPMVLPVNDADGDPLEYSFRLPFHGTLTGTPPNLIYTPGPNYFGQDSFVYEVNDGYFDSGTATVLIDVLPVNDAPVADDQLVSLPDGEPIELVLTASDVDGPSLTFAIASRPTQGQLVGTPPSAMYVPRHGFSGDDSFTFAASDGFATSAEATVTLSVRQSDAGVPSPPLDGGDAVDAGTVVDGGATTDAGVNPTPEPPAGCGCSSSSGLWTLVLLALVRRRERRRVRAGGHLRTLK